MYKVKKQFADVTFWMGKTKYFLPACDQATLKFLFDSGIKYIDYIEPKEEVKAEEEEPKKVTKKRKSKK